MNITSHPAYVAHVVKICEERFWSKVEIKGDDECWPWKGTHGLGKYGSFKSVGGFIRAASREAYEMLHGPQPTHLVVCHSCDNRECCNPKHLWLGTVADNNHDRDRKGRQVAPRGSAHSKALLNEEKVREIRTAHAAGTRQVDLAKKYGVTPTVINFVIKGRTWRHVE